MYSSLLVVSMLISQTSGRLVQGRRVFYDPRIYNAATATYRGPFEGLSSRPASEQVVLHSAQFMMWLNEYRRERGLQPADYALYLEAAAQGNNVQQVLHGTGHYTVSSSYRECVCRRATWEGARDAWLAEPSNRAVLMSPTLKRIGIAEYRYQWTLAVEDVESLGGRAPLQTARVAVPEVRTEDVAKVAGSEPSPKRLERSAQTYKPLILSTDKDKRSPSTHERSKTTRTDPPMPGTTDALAGLR